MPKDVDLAELSELTVKDFESIRPDAKAVNPKAQKALDWVVTRGAMKRGTIVAFPKTELSVAQLAAFRRKHIEQMQFAVFQDDQKLYVKARPRSY